MVIGLESTDVPSKALKKLKNGHLTVLKMVQLWILYINRYQVYHCHKYKQAYHNLGLNSSANVSTTGELEIGHNYLNYRCFDI